MHFLMSAVCATNEAKYNKVIHDNCLCYNLKLNSESAVKLLVLLCK